MLIKFNNLNSNNKCNFNNNNLFNKPTIKDLTKFFKNKFLMTITISAI